MKIVSSQTDEDVAKAAARQTIERSAALLAANMLRVIRGAGKPHDLLPAMQSCLDAAHAFYELHRTWPISEVQDAIQPDGEPPYLNDLPDHEVSRVLAINDIIDGALQVAASRLLEQRTQEAAGETQMMRGINRLEEAREAARKSTATAVLYEEVMAPRGRKKK